MTDKDKDELEKEDHGKPVKPGAAPLTEEDEVPPTGGPPAEPGPVGQP